MKSKLIWLYLPLTIAVNALATESSTVVPNEPPAVLPNELSKIGKFTIYDEQAHELLDANAELEVLASGFEWTEGPVWDTDNQRLLFVDIPNNNIHSYSPSSGLDVFLHPSNRANGLLIDHKRQLVMMQTGARAVSKLVSGLDSDKHTITQVVSHFQDKRLNSPNDVAQHKNGTLFFTDPPYGLAKQLNDPAKELDFQGVYRLSTDGELSLIDKELTFPNGIAISPDNKTLYVAVSDEASPAWYQYSLDEQGNVTDKSLLFKPAFKGIAHGVPDGLKVHSSGVVFATGPQGVWLFAADKRLLAHIAMPGFTANLAFNQDESAIYLTAHNELRRLKLNSL
ncbi:MAG: SMP-30/gluconolactonase/LRE family protein [Gammaproteobacteria bacterium]|nr:SMP-30/gluconolactonase/LRE family protein [Gammaproteobacteria bacterium]